MLTPRVKKLLLAVLACLILAYPSPVLSKNTRKCANLVADIRAYSRQCAACANRELRQANTSLAAAAPGTITPAEHGPTVCDDDCGSCVSTCQFDLKRSFVCASKYPLGNGVCIYECKQNSGYRCTAPSAAPASGVAAASAAATPAHAPKRRSCMDHMESEAGAMSKHCASCANRSVRSQQEGTTTAAAAAAGGVIPSQTRPPLPGPNVPGFPSPQPRPICDENCGACIGSCISNFQDRWQEPPIPGVGLSLRDFCAGRCITSSNYVSERLPDMPPGVPGR